MYGRELTACVLPPLATLLASRGGEPLPETPTLAQLGGQLHSVPSSFACEKALEKARKKALKAAGKAGSGKNKKGAVDVLVKDE